MSQRNGFLALVMVMGSLCACRDDRQPVAATPTIPTPTAPTISNPPAIVHGTVLDFQTGQPLPGAVVGFATDFVSGPIGLTETAVSDANGRYSLPEPSPRANNRPFIFSVNNQYWGTGYPRAANYRADVAVDKGRCVARYGMVLDSRTLLPVVGATARSLSNVVRATTDREGWYHIDWGCGVGSVGFNTTWHIMSHTDYSDAQFAGGRGISGALREDVLLTPR